MREIDLDIKFKVGDTVMYNEGLAKVQRVWVKPNLLYCKTKILLEVCYTIKPKGSQRVKVMEEEITRIRVNEGGIAF